jgi:nucleoside-diphosphate-sugar epimerase
MASLDSYRGVTAAVLGVSGFIGRWVARALAHAGARAILVARSASSIPVALRTADVSIVEADLSSEATVREVFARLEPAVVFNLAGYGVDRSERDERVALTINAELPRWIVEALGVTAHQAWSGQRLIHVGSALEYGEIGGDLAESSSPNPTTLYGRTKLAGTLAVHRACSERKMRGITARLFTVYGWGEHAGRLLPTLMQAATHNEPIPLSAGLQRRDFTYVEDVAEGLLRLGAGGGGATPGDILNLATGRLTTVREFATEAARVLGIPAERLAFGALPTRAEEMQHDPVSVERLRALLGWVPSTSIADGVRRTITRPSVV